MMMMDDDDYDQEEMKGHHSSHGLSKAEQRRSNKPIMEKKRRARINHCLNELKSLILDAMKKDPARHSKLEKADILEMTVKHLQTVQRQQLAVAVATDPNVLHKFKSGFNECAGEVSRYIGHLDGVEIGVKQRLVSHLANCVTGLQQLSPFGFGSSGLFGNAQDSNNNTRVSGPQLVQSRIPGSDLGLHIPSTNQTQASTNYYSSPSNLPTSTVTSATIGTHSSAFTAVHRNMDVAVKSPPLSPSSSIASSEDSDYLITTTRHYQTIAHQPKYGESFKIPLRSPSNFKAFAPVEHKSPPQHQVVSSTVISQDQSPPQTYAQVKLEFKSLPMSRTVPIQQPLSVVTSQVYNIPGIGENRKNPLDFSLKSRQCVATQTLSVTPSVKRSFPVAFEQSNDLISSSIVSPDKVPRFEVNVVGAQEGRAFYRDGSGERRRDDRPSTSTSSQEDKDMWRPW